jgi:purine-binding chemotaxis protein CheW
VPELQRALLVFDLAGQIAALPLESVERVMHMAQLGRPPGLPSPLEGILNLAGKAVPVMHLERLLQLPDRTPGLYSMLIVLRQGPHGEVAIRVDRVNEILSVPESALLPVAGEHSFNAFADATVSVRGQVVHLLSPQRMLLESERESLSAFQALAQRRLQEWELTSQ